MSRKGLVHHSKPEWHLTQRVSIYEPPTMSMQNHEVTSLSRIERFTPALTAFRDIATFPQRTFEGCPVLERNPQSSPADLTLFTTLPISFSCFLASFPNFF